jgi:hypothetical protein
MHVARNKAYGGSGSGQPSDRLHKVIERSAERAKQPSFCYKFVSEGSCSKGKDCFFQHPRADQWTTEMVEFVQAEISKSRSRDDRPMRVPARHSSIEAEDELVVPDCAVPGASVRLKDE